MTEAGTGGTGGSTGGSAGKGGSTGGSGGTGGSTGGSAGKGGSTGGSGGTGGSTGGARDASDSLVTIDTPPPLDVIGPPESGANDGAADVSGPTESGANDAVGGSDASDAGDSSSDAGKDGIYCGSTRCNPSTQVCCAESGALDPGSTLALRCVAKGMCSGTSPMNIPCDDHADCAISNPTLPVCCAGTSSGMPGGSFILFECTIPSGCVSTSTVTHVYMCSGPDDTTSCPTNTACKPGQLRDGFFTCQ